MSNSPDQAVSSSEDHDIHALLRKHGPASFDYDHPDNQRLADFLAQELYPAINETLELAVELSWKLVLEKVKRSTDVTAGAPLPGYIDSLAVILRGAMVHMHTFTDMHAFTELLNTDSAAPADENASRTRNLVLELVQHARDVSDALSDELKTLEEQFAVLDVLGRLLLMSSTGDENLGHSFCFYGDMAEALLGKVKYRVAIVGKTPENPAAEST